MLHILFYNNKRGGSGVDIERSDVDHTVHGGEVLVAFAVEAPDKHPAQTFLRHK